eukprot:11215737-Lingulodinium_polyedra.AAC.1
MRVRPKAVLCVVLKMCWRRVPDHWYILSSQTQERGVQARYVGLCALLHNVPRQSDLHFNVAIRIFPSRWFRVA